MCGCRSSARPSVSRRSRSGTPTPASSLHPAWQRSQGLAQRVVHPNPVCLPALGPWDRDPAGCEVHVLPAHVELVLAPHAGVKGDDDQRLMLLGYRFEECLFLFARQKPETVVVLLEELDPLDRIVLGLPVRDRDVEEVFEELQLAVDAGGFDLLNTAGCVAFDVAGHDLP